MAVNDVLVYASKIYYEYRPKTQSLEVTFFYISRHSDGSRNRNHRVDLEFTRTAYSYAEIKSVVRDAVYDELSWYAEMMTNT